MTRPLSILFMVALTIGCQPRPSAPPAATRPLATRTEFTGPGIRLSYPSGWSSVASAELVLRLAPSPASKTVVSLDVPKLPPHIPGLIPLGAVVNGYVDDLKKHDPGVNVEQPVETKVAGANARRVRSTRTLDGSPLVEDAVLTVHGDRVYIFRANTEPSDQQDARDALNVLIDSVQWR